MGHIACRNWGVSPADFQQLARLPALPETARNSCLLEAVAALEGGAAIPYGALASHLLLASAFPVGRSAALTLLSVQCK
jgi:hypothetical protein